MNITSPPAATIAAAAQGDLKALDAILVQIQPGVFNLAIRMLGNRDDAADAAQEILLKVVTHLGTFKGESAFSTWVFRIARNQVLNAITRSKESPEVSLDAMQERLQQGLDYGESLRPWGREGESLTPEDKLAARQVALGCTQNMLMAVDREHRLVYLLDTVFGLSSREAGAGHQPCGLPAAAGPGEDKAGSLCPGHLRACIEKRALPVRKTATSPRCAAEPAGGAPCWAGTHGHPPRGDRRGREESRRSAARG